MIKNIADYLPFILGCECNCTDYFDEIFTLVGIDVTSGKCQLMNTNGGRAFRGADMVKPILRPIPDITEEEVINLVFMQSDVYKNVAPIQIHKGVIRFEFEYSTSSRRRVESIKLDELKPKMFMYLLKQGFDIFGLIEAKLAVKKKTLKSNI